MGSTANCQRVKELTVNTKNGKCSLVKCALKGHSQLVHMGIRYHLLADLHITRYVHETESEKSILWIM